MTDSLQNGIMCILERYPIKSSRFYLFGCKNITELIKLSEAKSQLPGSEKST